MWGDLGIVRGGCGGGGPWYNKRWGCGGPGYNKRWVWGDLGIVRGGGVGGPG